MYGTGQNSPPGRANPAAAPAGSAAAIGWPAAPAVAWATPRVPSTAAEPASRLRRVTIATLLRFRRARLAGRAAVVIRSPCGWRADRTICPRCRKFLRGAVIADEIHVEL